jgi:hypothetical protein
VNVKRLEDAPLLVAVGEPPARIERSRFVQMNVPRFGSARTYPVFRNLGAWRRLARLIRELL